MPYTLSDHNLERIRENAIRSVCRHLSNEALASLIADATRDWVQATVETDYAAAKRAKRIADIASAYAAEYR